MAKDDKTPEAKFTQADIDAAVQKAVTQNGYKLNREELGDLMKAVLPATIMAMEQAKNQTAHDITMKQLKLKQSLEERCTVCRQPVGDGKTRGCGGPWKRNPDGSFVMVDVLDDKGNKTGEQRRVEDPAQFHDQMVVFPNDPIAERQFDGVTINGAHYRSQGPTHKVWVPRVNNIASMLMKFEEDQRIQQVGRKHMRQSGSVSGNGGQQISNPTFT